MTSLKPRASTRISIQWEGEPATEETDTLVLTLTFGYTGKDIRLREQYNGHKLEVLRKLVREQLAPVMKDLPALTFIPTISSVPAPPPGVEVLPDQGTFKTMPNGDVEEYGTMFNWATGRNQEYIEVWRRLSLRSPLAAGEHATDTTFLLLKRKQSSTWPRVQSFVGHIGQYGLGISRIQDTSESDPRFLGWREVFDFEQAGWERVYTVGSREEVDLYLPSLNSFSKPDHLRREGETVSVQNEDWILECR
ncbi:hypothetical protein QFC21_006726 [Naganishia friedmannii]|uniref:Uncharacterized protein n=1 Tax=Naganishia friedmannii TaxID=89922 RepID=A0ACC2V095_9TREE|nr:hypothetical protein QFC21_006726 [Naganishia friedmannii]